jgi:hypothetical protein
VGAAAPAGELRRFRPETRRVTPARRRLPRGSDASGDQAVMSCRAWPGRTREPVIGTVASVVDGARCACAPVAERPSCRRRSHSTSLGPGSGTGAPPARLARGATRRRADPAGSMTVVRGAAAAGRSRFAGRPRPTADGRSQRLNDWIRLESEIRGPRPKDSDRHDRSLVERCLESLHHLLKLTSIGDTTAGSTRTTAHARGGVALPSQSGFGPLAASGRVIVKLSDWRPKDRV